MSLDKIMQKAVTGRKTEETSHKTVLHNESQDWIQKTYGIAKEVWRGKDMVKELRQMWSKD